MLKGCYDRYAVHHCRILSTCPAPLTVDVAIVGGGIVGLTLAAALRSSGLRVAVVEAQTAEGAAARRRAYAFSLTSADIFKGLGLWPQVGPHICHFQQVRLSDGDHPQVVRFSPQDLGSEAVYYGAEHQVLMAALQQAVAQASNIHYFCEATLTVSDRNETAVTATLTTPAGVRSPRLPWWSPPMANSRPCASRPTFAPLAGSIGSLVSPPC